MLANDLCEGEAIPPKIDRALRARFTTVARRLDTVAASDGRKRVRLLEKARRALSAVDRKAAAALEAKRSDQRISAACQSEIGGIVHAIEPDLS